VIDGEGDAIGVMTFPAHHPEIVQALISGAAPALRASGDGDAQRCGFWRAAAIARSTFQPRISTFG